MPAEEVGEKATDPNKRFGHLVIKGDAAKGKQVWFDSKRMLGKGERSFLVFCGMHQMAITDGATTRVTADTLAKDVEVPCNGESDRREIGALAAGARVGRSALELREDQRPRGQRIDWRARAVISSIAKSGDARKSAA